MERIINIKVSGNHLTKDGKNAGTRGEANATILRITFDEGWDGYAKSVVFLDAHGMNPTRFTLTTNLLENIAESTRIYLVPIPPSSLAVAGEMSFSIDGYIDGKRQRSVIAMLEVEDGIITDVIDDITPTQAEQLQAQYESIVQDIQQAAISRNEAEAFAENAKKSAESAEQTKGEVEALKQETLEKVNKGIETVLFWKNDALSGISGSKNDALSAIDTNKNAALTEIAGVKDGAISAIDTNKQQALSEMGEYKEEALEDVDKLVEKATDLKYETLWCKQDAETSAQRAENHFNKAKEKADDASYFASKAEEKADDASYFASKAEDAAIRAKASADTAVLSAEQVEDYANRVIEVPEGEVAPQGIFEMEEGIYLLKGKFHYYPLDCDFTNETGYNPVIDFEREVIACITKSEGEEDYYGSPVYWERKHLWYFDATANNNTGSQVIITVKYNSEDDVYTNSFKHTPNKYLERSSFKQREIDDLFYNRLADEEGRTEWYPTLGVMADYVAKAYPPIVNKSSGELISLADSAEQPLQSMKIFGKTEQFTTAGENLFDVSKVVEKSSGSAGDVTVNPDDSITVTVYTATNSTSVGVLGTLAPQLVVGETYTLNAETDSSNKYVYLKGSSESWYFGKSRTIKETDLTGSVLFYPNGYESSATFRKIQIVLGSTEKPYEPYTGGIPSPNPDYPQELVSVGDSGSTTEYVMGGNLFNNDTSLLKEIFYTTKTGGRGSRIGYEPIVLPAGTYTFTLTDLDTSCQKFIYGVINDKDDNFVSSCNLLQSTTNYTPLTITVNEGDKVIIYNGHAEMNSANRAKEFEQVQIQLNAGSVAKPYEPYKEQSLTIPTPNGLTGIPVSSGGNYTDSNGQQYVCDEVDFERGVYVQRVVKKICNGTESWQPSTGTGAAYRYFISRLGAVGSVISNACMCTHYVTTTISSSTTTIGINLVNSDSYGSAQLNLRPDNASNITVSELSVLLAENPITVYYALTTPIETPLTEEEIQAYKALHTNYPNTTIYNSDGAGAEVGYVADTKLYVDNKFAELQANILKATE